MELFIRGLTPARGGQFTPAECGHVNRLKNVNKVSNFTLMNIYEISLN